MCERIRRVCEFGSKCSLFPLGSHWVPTGSMMLGLLFGVGPASRFRFGVGRGCTVVQHDRNHDEPSKSRNEIGRLGKCTRIRRRHHRPMNTANHLDCDPVPGHGATRSRKFATTVKPRPGSNEQSSLRVRDLNQMSADGKRGHLLPCVVVVLPCVAFMTHRAVGGPLFGTLTVML